MEYEGPIEVLVDGVPVGMYQGVIRCAVELGDDCVWQGLITADEDTLVHLATVPQPVALRPPHGFLAAADMIDGTGLFIGHGPAPFSPALRRAA